MKKLILTLSFVLSGCATGSVTLTSPFMDNAAAQRVVFDAEGKYKLALIAANAYVALPLCTASKPPCATLSVVRALQKAQPAVRATLDSAELTVRTPGFGKDIYSSAAVAATTGLKAFTVITDSLK